MAAGTPILLYDGVCGLCDRTVQFILRHDRRGAIRFAPLQNARAQAILRRHGRNPSDLDTMYLVLAPESSSERLLARSAAARHVLTLLGGPWSFVALALRLVPTSWLDAGYERWIVRNRYRWFGRYDVCVPPRPEWRERFLDA
jgi:predicted DCC family thiol-disulfide oxidoreductase YuxK